MENEPSVLEKIAFLENLLEACERGWGEPFRWKGCKEPFDEWGTYTEWFPISLWPHWLTEWQEEKVCKHGQFAFVKGGLRYSPMHNLLRFTVLTPDEVRKLFLEYLEEKENGKSSS